MSRFGLFCHIVAVAICMTNGASETEELISIAKEPTFVPIQMKSNPIKRNQYKVLESEGLRSHFRSVREEPFYLEDNSVLDGKSPNDEFGGENSLRVKRESIEKDHEPLKAEEEVEKSESLPEPQQQIMESDYKRQTRSRGGNLDVNMDDMVGQRSMEIGMRRNPRVNFITQPRSLADLEIPEHRDLKSSMARNPDPIYKKPLDMQYPPDYYREYSRSGYYDDYHPMDRYDRYMPPARQDYYNRYDPYLYRPPINPYNNFYPDRRYDYPENRNYNYNGYPPFYMNEVGYMPPPSSNRRIVYYATLPEVVRDPSTENRYRNYRRLDYDDYYRYPESKNYRYSKSPPITNEQRNENGNRGIEERGRKSDTKPDSDSQTQTVSSNIRVQDGSKGYRNYSPGSNSNSGDFTQPHY